MIHCKAIALFAHRPQVWNCQRACPIAGVNMKVDVERGVTADFPPLKGALARERRRFLGAASALAAFMGLPFAVKSADKDSVPPVARRVQASDDYYGTTVEDPYRWMEDAKDPQLLPWLKAQDAYARSVLATVPGRDALR